MTSTSCRSRPKSACVGVDVGVGLAVIEIKKDVRKGPVREDAKSQLTGYVPEPFERTRPALRGGAHGRRRVTRILPSEGRVGRGLRTFDFVVETLGPRSAGVPGSGVGYYRKRGAYTVRDRLGNWPDYTRCRPLPPDTDTRVP
jgi:hypothetical protein